ncbi:DNA-binding PucR family transcriptional regulator [Aurantimicrobium minutum]|uniref:helix-turn-helix domain-containing protein n=1 Tax=Aurantimicrobium minutum TaxID=708131 RepID=UPI002475E203|nr:helix-turn-helix domain-containing protein [Aurantimicrobium minutum]MDH6255100.1 DNA-binding PucR family transcriptional regulator [Aurantimicrobium minutum]MDH6409925.1 DNA-binding PucR family transcriptional regulator [Aurantimicrobium minutum]MDH6424120.1 DNA-binding PucR family transcriptional regulator [Aurantimicrobium minutum]
MNATRGIEGIAERRAEVLSQLVRLFSSGKDPIGLAEAAVELVAEATGAKSVFVYFWEPDVERLVLRIVTQVDIDLKANTIQMRLGEGITGWSGLHRKPVILNKGIHDDPRFLKIDHVSETGYGSVITVPIYDDVDLYGVFALYAANEDAFGDVELAIAEEVGLLLASGLKRAETVRELEVQSATARFLTETPISAGISNNSAARYSVQRALELLEANACVMVHATTNGTDQVVIAEKVEGSTEPRISLTVSPQAARDAELRFEQSGLSRITATLGAGFSRGLVMCFRSKPFSEEEARQLKALVAQISLLLDNSGSFPHGAAHHLTLLASKNNEVITQNLIELGWRQKNSLVALIQIKHFTESPERLSAVLNESLTQFFGAESLLILSGNSIILIIPASNPADGASLNERFTPWANQLQNEHGLILEVGVSDPTEVINNISESFAQAQSALLWAQSNVTGTASLVLEYKEISSVRGLPRVIDTMKSQISLLEKKMKKLDSYDQQHGTKLLETLEAFANLGGSVIRTSEELYVHRNTLRQRLTRIEDIISLTLDDCTHWTEVVLAAKLIRLGTR